jgi:hypothetical protein
VCFSVIFSVAVLLPLTSQIFPAGKKALFTSGGNSGIIVTPVAAAVAL